MKIKYAKALRSIAKIALLLCFLSLLGLGIFFTYRSLKYKPYKVRVSNVTDSAFTVSWVTEEPMVGVVYYGDKDSFLPGPLAWIGKQKAVDDRDVSNAQTECVSEFNKKASKTKDANFTVDIEGYDCNNVKVSKRGKYYTHHVTVQNLDAEKEYYFRVGDGYISYAKNSGTYTEGEVEGIDIFATKTKPVFTDITSPNPAYGTTEMVYQTSDGYFTFNKNYDSIVFLKVKNEDNEYGVFSSVANNDGGWSIDLSNVRDGEGLPVNLDDSILVFMPQAENHKAFVFEEFEYGKVVFPLRLPGNEEEDLQAGSVGLASNLISKLVYKSAAQTYNAGGCQATGIYGRLEYCGNQCYRKWTRGSELCGWQKVSSGCPSKPCTCPGENCNPPAPEPPAPPAATCPIYGSPIIGDFTTVCHQPSCTCTNSLAKATSVTCGNKCEKKATDCTSGLGSLADFSSTCRYTNCRCTHPDSDGKNALCGDSCKRKASSPPSEPPGTIKYYKYDNKTKTCNEFTPSSIYFVCNAGSSCYHDETCGDKPLCLDKGSDKIGDSTTQCQRQKCKCEGEGIITETINCLSFCRKSVTATDPVPNPTPTPNPTPNPACSAVDTSPDKSDILVGVLCLDPGGCECFKKRIASEDYLGEVYCGNLCDENSQDSQEPIELTTTPPPPAGGQLYRGILKSFANNLEGNGNYLFHVPESGTYLFKLLRGEEKKIVSDGKTSYYFYYNRNGEEGYQEPEDLSSVKADEDLLVEAEVAVISISKIAETKEIKLSQGINIVSFDFMPNSIDDPYTSTDFLKRANEKGNKVSHISYFSGGKWDGGTSYDFETKETKGVSFNLGFGKGYIIVAEEDTIVTIPGYNVQSPVPLAFSSGWNLVGVHGYGTQYTANSLINSINTIEGLKSNNVTYWPTSKGMYQGYQLSEGQSYGQDFSISKDLGYFVRISEFNAPDNTCKSIIWNPGGDLNGKCGSGN